MFVPLHGGRRDGSTAFAVGSAFMLLAMAGCSGNQQAPVTLTQQGA